DANHQGDAWAVDSAVQQANLSTQMFQGAGKVDRTGGLADAAFAAGDSNDSINARDFVLVRPGALRSGSGREADVDMVPFDVTERANRSLGVFLDLAGVLRAGGTQL